MNAAQAVFLQKMAAAVGSHSHYAKVVCVVCARRGVFADRQLHERGQGRELGVFVLVVRVAVYADRPAAAASVGALAAGAAKLGVVIRNVDGGHVVANNARP